MCILLDEEKDSSLASEYGDDGGDDETEDEQDYEHHLDLHGHPHHRQHQFPLHLQEQRLQQQQLLPHHHPPQQDQLQIMPRHPHQANMQLLDETTGIMNDDELSNLNIKDLNRKLKDKGLPKHIIEKLKQRRRTLKNRKYATDCREKKDTEVQHLEGSKDAETHALRPIVEENERLRREINEMKEKYRRMKEFAEKNDLQIRERNVPMGANSEATASNTSSSRMKILKGKDKRVVGL